LIEHWNGTSWSIDTTGPEIEGEGLSAVAVVSSNNAWAVGSVIEHWNGTSWSTFTNAGGLSAISADSANDIWAIGGLNILHFDGTNWTAVASHPNVDATSVTALSPTNVWVVGTVSIFFNHRTHSKPAIEHWDGTSWSLVPSPNPNQLPNEDSFLRGIAAISANDMWAVGQQDSSGISPATLTEHWNGTSWKIIGSPNPGNFSNGLFGVTALSDGTVAAVGFQQDKGFDKQPLILQHSWRDDQRSAQGPAAPTTAMPATLDAAVVDQLFASAPAKVDQPLPLAGHGSRAHELALDGDLDLLPEGMWL
jgi:hypothetical protein